MKLERLAERLGFGGLWVKDESERFGLNAFKVLGETYARGKVLARKLSISSEGDTDPESYQNILRG